jgi:two-component system cell cycle response regulator
MVTALDQPEDRLRGLRAGADDFLTKPVNDIALFSRLKSLVRLKMLTDELRVRAESGGTAGSILRPLLVNDDHGRILVVDPNEASHERISGAFAAQHSLTFCLTAQDALERAARERFELAVVSLSTEELDGLRLVSQLRSSETTRQMPILVVVDPTDQQALLRALDMGVNDYLLRPVDRQELQARVTTQIKRWRYTEQLRQTVKASIEMAITDPLTGLYNRRYLETHLQHLAEHHINRGKNLSVLAIDADHFKNVNDSHGHDAGDAVLRDLGARIRQATRSVDLCCRTGGEEFVLVLPGTDLTSAAAIAERLRRLVAGKSFDVGEGKLLPVTVSIGVACLEGPGDDPTKLLKRADEALYAAKREGRNRIEIEAAA